MMLRPEGRKSQTIICVSVRLSQLMLSRHIKVELNDLLCHTVLRASTSNDEHKQ